GQPLRSADTPLGWGGTTDRQSAGMTRRASEPPDLSPSTPPSSSPTLVRDNEGHADAIAVSRRSAPQDPRTRRGRCARSTRPPCPLGYPAPPPTHPPPTPPPPGGPRRSLPAPALVQCGRRRRY